MYYRIVLPPPGYHGFMVAEYQTLEYQSYTRALLSAEGSRFFSTIGEAISALPPATSELPFERYAQFIKLFESSNAPA